MANRWVQGIVWFRSVALAAVLGLMASGGVHAEPVLYWGGGSTDIANGTALPQDTNGIAGVWSLSTENWSTAYTPGDETYVPFAQGSMAVLGFITNAAAGVHDYRGLIELKSDVSLAGILCSLQRPLSSTFRHRFVLSNSAAQVITPVGTSFSIRVLSTDQTRRLDIMSNIAFSGSAPMMKQGYGILQIHAKNPLFTGTLNVRGGIMRVENGADLAGTTNILIAGFPILQASGYGGNSFDTPRIEVYPGTSPVGLKNQLHDQAVITLERGELTYQGARHNTEASASVEYMRRLVIRNFGRLSLGSAYNSAQTYRGKLYLTDASTGLSRGPNGRGMLQVAVASASEEPQTDIVVQNGVTVGDVLPWIATTRAEFMRLNPTTKALERVPSTQAPTDLSTWVTASDYRVGTGAAYGPVSGTLGNVTINSLGFFTSSANTFTIGNGNTLTIASGGIAFSAAHSANHQVLTGGKLTSGTSALYLHGSAGTPHSQRLDINCEITGNIDVYQAGISAISFRGSENNTYSGTTYVQDGYLECSKTGNAIAIPGNLVISRSGSVQAPVANLADTTAVTLEEDGLFRASANGSHGGVVTIHGGRYHMPNVSVDFQAPGTGLAFNGGRIEQDSTALGLVSLQCDVSYAASSTRQAIWQRLSTGGFAVELDGTNRTFQIANSTSLPSGVPEMVFMTAISNGQGTAAGSGIIKTGSGVLQFVATNGYSGTTLINEGTLHVAVHRGAAYSGLRATAYSTGSHYGEVTFHEPVATNFVIGQQISGGIASSARTIKGIMSPYEIHTHGGGGISTEAVDVAVAAYHSAGTLGSGPVTNNGGTLLVDAGISLANAITIASGTVSNFGTFTGALTLNGGTLTGTGTNSGPAILNGGVVLSALAGGATVNGTLSPAGTATGTLAVTGNVTWNSGSSFSTANDWIFQLGPGGASDRLVLSGDFIQGAGAAFRFDFAGYAGQDTFTLVEWGGSLSGFTAGSFSYVNLAPGYAAAFSIVGNELRVTVTSCAVPPTVSLGAVPAQCSPVANTGVTVSHTTGGSPVSYSIDFSDAANSAGFTDVVSAAYSASPLPFTIPAGVAAGSYTARVFMTEGSGCRGEGSFTIAISATPAIPGAIAQANGGSSICHGSAAVGYSIAPVSGATTYTWTPPTGASIVSGQGTTSIVLNWGTAAPGSANLLVNAGNSCGTSDNRSTAFSVTAGVPDAPVAGAPSDVSISSFTANWAPPTPIANSAAQGYALDISTASDFSGSFVVSNQGVSISITNYTVSGLSGGLTYYYRVRAYNACGSSGNSATISVLTPQVLIGWDLSGLAGGSGDYGADGMAASYRHPGVTVGGLTRGAGVTQSGVGAPRGWGGTGWNSTTAATAIADSKFATFTASPVSGNYVSFYSVALMDYRRSGDGPTHGVLQYATDGSSFTTITNITYPGSGAEGESLPQVPVIVTNITALQNVAPGGTITFRVVNHGAASASGDWYLYDHEISTNYDFEIRGTVCSNPPVFSVTGGGSYCSTGAGVNVGLSSSTPGVTYQLRRDNGGSPVNVGTGRAGTGGNLSFGLQSVADTYTVVATRNSGGCSANMSGSALVTVTAAPDAPTDLAATPDDGEVELSWTAPGGSVTGYNVKRAAVSGGPYTTVFDGTNVATTTFTDGTALNGNTYYYIVTALDGVCEGSVSDEVEAVMPSGCPVGYVPSLSSPGNKSVNVGSSLSHAIVASEISDGCTAPTLSHTALPAGMGYADEVNGRFRTRTFTWIPSNGQQGSYPITVTATDTEALSTSRTFVIYVGNLSESGNGGSSPPPSQHNWHVGITNLDPVVGNEFELVWETEPGVAYDVYRATNFPGGAWTRILTNAVTGDSSNEHALTHSGETTYLQVVPNGLPVGTNGVWAIISPTVPAGMSMLSPPLRSDLAFDGEMGAILADALPDATLIYIMTTPGASPSWTQLRLDGATWLLNGPNTPYTTPLSPGQGFFVSTSGSAVPRFTGPVGNTGGNSISLVTGYNVIGLSEGKNIAAATAFEGASPTASFDEEQADQILVQNADGSWRRLIRQPTSPARWYDTQAMTGTSLQLTPGKAYYYIRKGTGTSVSF